MQKVRFEDLNLPVEIKKAIDDMGFEETTPIQAQSIPLLRQGKDICGQAQTGTGKTLAFGIPIIEKIDARNKKPQAIVLCPTRELAIQVSEEFRKLSKHKRGVQVLAVYGGQAIDRQLRALEIGVQIIVGTPGRVLDHLDRGTIDLRGIKMAVLDEADEMLDMGFVDDIETILRKTPKEKQTMFFSATMPKEFLGLTHKYQKSPIMVKVVHEVLTVPNTEQYYCEVREGGKIETLSRLIDFYNLKSSLVFCNTKKEVDEVVDHLVSRGYSALGLHGDLKQVSRDRVMAKFKRGAVEILIATDVAARGLDIDDIEAVFNYDMPQDEERYVHRIGRTGRMGKAGKAFTFVVGREIYELKDIQRYAKVNILRQKVPSFDEVEEIRNNLLLERIKKIIKEGHLSKYVSYVESLLSEDYTSLDVAAAMLKIIIGTDDEEFDDDDLNNTGAEPGMVRLFINIGKAQNMNTRDFISAIQNEAKIDGRLIKNLNILDKFSFFEVPLDKARGVLVSLKDKQIKNMKVFIAPAMKK
ncbi:MAG: DEAD/DEAH box helicase [Candidatus Firestonebacteria bacterium]